ncbi:MAG: hypothetical protein AB1442_11515 [Nitrospirota bacterium]
MKSVFVAISICAAVILPASFAEAQDKPADNMDIIRDKVRADKKLMIAMNMELTETEAKAFWPVYEKYQNEWNDLAERTVRMIEDYAKSYNFMTNEKAGKLLDEYLAIECDRTTLFKSYMPEFRKVLSDRKVARYYQIENKIQSVINYELAKQIPLVE